MLCSFLFYVLGSWLNQVLDKGVCLMHIPYHDIGRIWIEINFYIFSIISLSQCM